MGRKAGNVRTRLLTQRALALLLACAVFEGSAFPLAALVQRQGDQCQCCKGRKCLCCKRPRAAGSGPLLSRKYTSPDTCGCAGVSSVPITPLSPVSCQFEPVGACEAALVRPVRAQAGTAKVPHPLRQRPPPA